LRYTCILTVSASPQHLLHALGVEGGVAMTFEEIFDQAMVMFRRRGR